MMTDEISVRDVLRLPLEGEPRQSNTDWHAAAELEAEVLTRAKRAIGSPDDPLEFRAWLDALRIPTNTNPATG